MTEAGPAPSTIVDRPSPPVSEPDANADGRSPISAAKPSPPTAVSGSEATASRQTLAPRPAPAPVRASEPRAPVAGVPCATTDGPEQIWAAVLGAASSNDALSAKLRALTLTAISPERAIVGHSVRGKIAAELAKGDIERLLGQVLGRSVPVLLQPLATTDQPRLVRGPLDDGAGGEAGERGASPAAAPRGPAIPSAEVLAEANHPLVVKAIEMLGATVQVVRPRAD